MSNISHLFNWKQEHKTKKHTSLQSICLQLYKDYDLFPPQGNPYYKFNNVKERPIIAYVISMIYTFAIRKVNRQCVNTVSSTQKRYWQLFIPEISFVLLNLFLTPLFNYHISLSSIPCLDNPTNSFSQPPKDF